MEGIKLSPWWQRCRGHWLAGITQGRFQRKGMNVMFESSEEALTLGRSRENQGFTKEVAFEHP